MITNEQLLSTSSKCTTVNLADEYAQAAYQPTKYCTQIDNRKHAIRVFLTEFVYRASPDQRQPLATR